MNVSPTQKKKKKTKASASVSALPSISFITGQQRVKHLGVCLGYDMSAACHQTFTGIHQAIQAKARMCFVQVDRLKRCCGCLRGLHYDSSDMNDALRMYIIPLIQDVLLA